ncbi:hypothetical protein M413DRAFT_12595 [Hebeloma cylindrosporum]|uniref:Uncharacterized protein n=1 Tax=Hebeloma cylindrosporum TaxID=76867 RepID=A0A0C2YCF6_HEBCY|nr:hypothetical protein M413DRAFT_12595 [Hebeloma cylindrosporum h7]
MGNELSSEYPTAGSRMPLHSPNADNNRSEYYAAKRHQFEPYFDFDTLALDILLGFESDRVLLSWKESPEVSCIDASLPIDGLTLECKDLGGHGSEEEEKQDAKDEPKGCSLGQLDKRMTVERDSS